MDCKTARECMGAYLDGESPPEQAARLENHISHCPACVDELSHVSACIASLSEGDCGGHMQVPPQLWDAIEARLDARGRKGLSPRILRLLHKPLAMAASLALLIGAGTFVALLLNPSPQAAQATPVVDYSVLLDGVNTDVEAAFGRFLRHYHGQAVTLAAATAWAPELRFAIPPELPGGFRFEQSYRLQFGSVPGVAALYRRDREPLIVFFHPPVNKEKLGIHRESHCDVAGRSGHRVEVGAWRLIHFTDPTTCHCILSRLDNESELHKVMAAVSPDFPPLAGDYSH